MVTGGVDVPRLRLADRVARGLAPYPLVLLILACVTPYVAFANANSGEAFAISQLVLYSALTAGFAVGAYIVALLLTPRSDPNRVAIAIATVVLSFFNFSTWLSPHPKPEVFAPQLIGWFVVTALAAFLAYRFARSRPFRLWLGATIGIVCLANGASYVLSQTDAANDTDVAEDDGSAVTPDHAVRQPNVYAFLLDHYARNDVLADTTGYDNEPFHAQLRDRGFEVTDESLASYPKTTFSMMSMFEMGYPVTSAHDVEGNFSFDHYLVGDNSTVERFHQLGYQFIHAHGGPFAFARCDGDHADICLPANAEGVALGDLELSLLDLTPVGTLDLFDTPWNDPGYVLDTLEATETDEPFFLFSHIISPHPPYRFDDDCNRHRRPVSRSSLTPEADRLAYANDIECLDAVMVDTIDRITESDPDAVILVFSDHGSDFLSPPSPRLEDWSDEQLLERFGTQNALLLPQDCRGNVQADTPNVHDFEIVFACIEGRPPDLGDFRAFFWDPGSPHQLEEISAGRLTVAGDG